MAERINEGRRRFLKISAAAGGGLLIGFSIMPQHAPRATAGEAAAPFAPNAWLRIDTDGQVTILVASSEMGQGVMTAIPMLVAEELNADWAKVKAEMAPAKPDYFNPSFGAQATGGSTAVRAYWAPVREAGAVAREMLVAAAAETWGVSEQACRAENGEVIHGASGRRLSYGALAVKAATLDVPDVVFLKEPDEFQLLGKPMPRVDAPAKVDGSAVFGQDVRVAGMLTATVLRCPVFGGKLKTLDARNTKKIKGVRGVLEIPSGVAVVADGFWPARRGRDALKVTWDEGPNANLDSAEISRRLKEATRDPGTVARQEGDPEKAFAKAAKTVHAEYEVPYLAHACMEPMNCTAHVRKDDCDVWVPTQAQTSTQRTAAEITGLEPESIQVHTTFLGGGFGRRSEQDFIADAVQLSKAMDAPVQVLWTREDDLQHDYYRPATYNRFSAALDAEGVPVAWRHDIAGPSIFSRVVPHAVEGGIDRTSVEGAANIPYAIPNIEVTYTIVDPGVPVGFWRSVGSSQNAYVTESFMDELAAAGGKDPVELRQRLLSEKPRHRGVLELAADKAGWGQDLPEGCYRGIAVAESFGSFVAQVAEISIDNDGAVRVDRVVCAVDCGMTVNPDTIEAQMQSGIVYGLTAALMGEITINKGHVVQNNFNDYPILRMDQMPKIEVHIVKSEQLPGGVGEPGTPPIAPAVTNAVFAATGTPLRRLPIRAANLRTA